MVTFEEFMSAKGEDVLLEYIETCWKTKTPLDQKAHVLTVTRNVV